ncbi:ATP-binding cassette domain-containing protein [Alkalibacillus almallahensis]|uniref:ATP-binding cassette domain-containing protein n=1 Tax=Alkalibacillus almallahensis TaxID=1379154 RepID=UPI00141E4B66|nr:ABC transporter ATP-binding protein [Alkalibacillus almallahensis]NIK13415.1 ABC-2 type transport system ATP-binding protein [Alkalibacillus almallahensis]
MIKMLDVSKKIKKTYVLKEISYTFDQGNIYGIFGKNGSGKTMLLRSIAGLVVPTEGQVDINGRLLHKDISFPPNVGVIIENMELLPQYDAFTNLYILSKIKKIATKDDIEETIRKVGLDPNSKLKVKDYSLGMKQRLNIAQALFEKPDILLLDEPTNAIDESGVNLVYDLLLEEKKRGATVLIASHHKEDISLLCDDTLKMADGMLTNE